MAIPIVREVLEGLETEIPQSTSAEDYGRRSWLISSPIQLLSAVGYFCEELPTLPKGGRTYAALLMTC